MKNETDQRLVAARRTELGVFLRAQRACLQPDQAGLDPGPRQRRTPGLRREEVAQLSGVGLTWYTWLEQGRDIPRSAQVIDALARALQLDPDRHQHLRALAAPSPSPSLPADGELLRLQRLVDATAPTIASIYDVHFDYVVWNTPYIRVRHDPGKIAEDRRNLLWVVFTDPDVRRSMPGWEPAARALLSQFRAAAGQGAGSPRFAELVTVLTETSPEFQKWWADYPIRNFTPAIIPIDHPRAGRINFEIFQLRPVESPGLVITLQVPITDDDRQSVQSLLP